MKKNGENYQKHQIIAYDVSGKSMVLLPHPLHSIPLVPVPIATLHLTHLILYQFCEPSGWHKTKGDPLPARFFVSVLTNLNGGRSYCASLTFQVTYEPDSMHASILKSLPGLPAYPLVPLAPLTWICTCFCH